MNQNLPEIPYTLDEFARLWRKSESTIRRRIREGKIRTILYGPREQRIPRHEAQRIMNYGTEHRSA